MSRLRDAAKDLRQLRGWTIEPLTMKRLDALDTAISAADDREAALVEALRGLVVQVERSHAVDDHGHKIEHLQALYVARRVLNGEVTR